eukprot:Pgem_evm2s8033
MNEDNVEIFLAKLQSRYGTTKDQAVSELKKIKVGRGKYNKIQDVLEEIDLQSFICDSSTGAEYYVLNEACKGMQYLNVLEELNMNVIA